MKKIITIISIILIALMFTGCSRRSATKSVRLDYIKENDGFTFKNYAIAIDDKKDNKNTYAIYKKIKSNKYQRLFRLDEIFMEQIYKVYFNNYYIFLQCFFSINTR